VAVQVRRMAAGWLFVLGTVGMAGVVSVVGAPSAGACSILPPGPTDEELDEQADVIFEGIAVSSRDPNSGAEIKTSGDPIHWSFAVDTVVKGMVAPHQEVTSARSGGTCGYVFQIGERYRVYASERNGVLRTGLGSGTRPAPPEPRPTTTTIPRAAPPLDPPVVRPSFTG
jgi:hypothetical protein